MKKATFTIILIFIVALSLTLSCKKTEESADAAGLALASLMAGNITINHTTRPFYLGLTPFPYSISSYSAIEYVYDKIGDDADLICHHFDNGIPWDQALLSDDHTTYPSKVTEDWDYRRSHIPAGHKLYVAINPINSMRNGLAPIWNETGDNQPLTTPWSGYAFNHADVKTAYLNYCRSVINYFNPDYIAIGVEVNLVMANIKPQWDAYLELHQDTFGELEIEYPDLPIFVTLTGIDLVEGYSNSNHTDQMAALADITPYTDYYAISLHPFFAEQPGATIPTDMFEKIFSSTLNTGSKPVCITETSFPAQRLTMTAYDPDITIDGTKAKQMEYFTLLLDEAHRLNMVFVVNFLVRDYDTLWRTALGAPEDILKAWRDTGFYDEFGFRRPVLGLWEAYLGLPVVH
jgi:hypothetical protein